MPKPTPQPNSWQQLLSNFRLNDVENSDINTDAKISDIRNCIGYYAFVKFLDSYDNKKSNFFTTQQQRSLNLAIGCHNICAIKKQFDAMLVKLTDTNKPEQDAKNIQRFLLPHQPFHRTLISLMLARLSLQLAINSDNKVARTEYFTEVIDLILIAQKYSVDDQTSIHNATFGGTIGDAIAAIFTRSSPKNALKTWQNLLTYLQQLMQGYFPQTSTTTFNNLIQQRQKLLIRLNDEIHGDTITQNNAPHSV